MSAVVVVAGKKGSVELRVPVSPLTVPGAAVPVLVGLIRDYVEMATSYLAGVAAERAPKNLGLLAQSLQANPAGSTGGIELLGGVLIDPLGAAPVEITGRVFSSLPYAYVMDQGRRKGGPISRAGVASIGLWVRRKLGLSGKEAQSAMYAIAWSIRHKGIKPTYFMSKAAQSARPRVQQIFETLNAALAQGLVQDRGGVV